MSFIKNHKKAICLLGLFFLASAGGSYVMFSDLLSKPASGVYDTSAPEKEQVKKAENKTLNFLLMGVDERSGDVGRSDTLIVLSANMATHKVGLISVPRDSRVEISRFGETKINHAYAYGGEQLTKAVVEKTLNIKTDHYFVINFTAFKNIIDSLGGIDIDVEKDMYYRDDYDGENGLIIDLKAGQQHMDGEKAIQYVRYRDEEGDIGRVHRQQKFIDAVLDKLTSPSIIPKIPSIVRQSMGAIKTDMTFSDIIEYLSYIDTNAHYETSAVMVAGTPQMIDDISYWIIDYNKLHEDMDALNNFIVGKTDSIAATSEEKKQAKEQGIFKDSPENKTDLDWQLEKLNAISEEREAEIKAKLLEDERKEREAESERRNYAAMLKRAEADAAKRYVVNETGIKIINTTSDTYKTDRAISAMQQQGLDIGAVNNKVGAGKPNPKTILIVSSKDKETIEKAMALPFKISVMEKQGEFSPTLIIGEDF